MFLPLLPNWKFFFLPFPWWDHWYTHIPSVAFPVPVMLPQDVYSHLKIWSWHCCLFGLRMAAASSSRFYMASISAMCLSPFTQSLLLGLFEAVCGARLWPLPGSFKELHKALSSVEKTSHQCKASLEADGVMSPRRFQMSYKSIPSV